jgi:hypothetical protein
MMRRWKLLGLHAVLATTLAAAPVAAEPPLPENTDVAKLTDSQKIDLLLRQVAEMKRSLNLLEALRNDMDKMRRSQFDIDADLANVRGDVGGLSQQVNKLNRDLQQVQRDLDALRGQMGSTPQQTTVRSSPAGSIAGPGLVGNAGRIRIRNTYPGEVNVRVNDRTYRVAPNETYVLDAIPAGTFTYELPGFQAPVTRVLPANETVTINVFNRSF